MWVIILLVKMSDEDHDAVVRLVMTAVERLRGTYIPQMHPYPNRLRPGWDVGLTPEMVECHPNAACMNLVRILRYLSGHRCSGPPDLVAEVKLLVRDMQQHASRPDVHTIADNVQVTHFLDVTAWFADQAMSLLGDLLVFDTREPGGVLLYYEIKRVVGDAEFAPFVGGMAWLAGCWTRAFDLSLRMLRIGRARATTTATDAHFSKWDRMLRAWTVLRDTSAMSGMPPHTQNCLQRIAFDGVGDSSDASYAMPWLDGVELPDV